MVEHFLGKEEVRGSNPRNSSKVIVVNELVRKMSGRCDDSLQIPVTARKCSSERAGKKRDGGSTVRRFDSNSRNSSKVK